MNIPSTLIESLLLESASFRSYVVGQLTNIDTTAFKKRVGTLVNTFGNGEKIAAIKAVRTLSVSFPEEFAITFNVILYTSHDYPKGVCGLADAKRIVESIKTF